VAFSKSIPDKPLRRRGKKTTRPPGQRKKWAVSPKGTPNFFFRLAKKIFRLAAGKKK